MVAYRLRQARELPLDVVVVDRAAVSAPHVQGEVVAPLVERPQPLGHPKVAEVAEAAPARGNGVDDQRVR